MTGMKNLFQIWWAITGGSITGWDYKRDFMVCLDIGRDNDNGYDNRESSDKNYYE